MIGGHLVSGVVLGALAAAAGLIVGYSVLASFGFYGLGSIIGFALSVAAVLLGPQDGNSRRTSIDNCATPAE